MSRFVEDLLNTDEFEIDDDGERDLWQVVFVLNDIRYDAQRILVYTESVVESYSVREFQVHFRLHRDTFGRLSELVAPSLHRGHSTGGRTPLTVEKSLLVGLWYLSNQECIRSISDITRSTVLSVCRRVCKALVQMAPEMMKWPNSAGGRGVVAVSDGFEAMKGFPRVSDGCHIPIKAPQVHQKRYINRKKFHCTASSL